MFKTIRVVLPVLTVFTLGCDANLDLNLDGPVKHSFVYKGVTIEDGCVFNAVKNIEGFNILNYELPVIELEKDGVNIKIEKGNTYISISGKATRSFASETKSNVELVNDALRSSCKGIAPKT